VAHVIFRSNTGAGIDSQTEFTHGTLVGSAQLLARVLGDHERGIFRCFHRLMHGDVGFVAGLSAEVISPGKGWNALLWLSALSFLVRCARGCGHGPQNVDYEVRLDSRGAEFKLGTKREPSNLFLTWDRIAAITHQRVGNAQEYRVSERTGARQSSPSYTFLRPKKVALTIADRAGKSIQTA